MAIRANTIKGVQISIADGIVYKNLLVAGTNGTDLYVFYATSDDTVNRTLLLSWNDGTNDFPIGSIIVAANSGTNGIVQSTNLFAAIPSPLIDQDGFEQKFMPIKKAEVGKQSKLMARVSTAMTSGAKIYIQMHLIDNL